MSLLSIPNVFANGTGPGNLIDALQMNANFTAVQTAVNNIYPSQILPLTSGQATFGATAVGVGYRFSANDATATPLIANAVGGQSADIFRVELTSGGTKALFVDSNGNTKSNTGVLAWGAATAYLSGLSTGDGSFSEGVSGGRIALGGTSSVAIIDFGVTSSGVLNLGTKAVSLNAAYAGGNAGDLSIGRSASVGVLFLGSSGTTCGFMDYGNTTAGKFSFQFDPSSASYAPVNGGLYTNSSDAAFKTNIAPIQHGSAAILALKPSSFTFTKDNIASLGFIAQDVQAVLPNLVSADGNGMLGVCYDGIIPVLVKAFQEMTDALHSAGVAGF